MAYSIENLNFELSFFLPFLFNVNVMQFCIRLETYCFITTPETILLINEREFLEI